MTETEVHVTPSKAQPGKQNILIVAATPERVQSAIWNMADAWSFYEFGYPTRTAEGRWAVMGRVW